jgi:hypothetical protein
MRGVPTTGDLRSVFDELLKEFRKNNDNRWEQVLKSLSTAAVPGTTTQFQPFNLDMVGKLLLPLLTPLQNMGAYGVKSGESGDSREYRAIVAKNTSKYSGIAPATTSANSVTTGTAGRAPVVDYSFLVKKKSFMKLAPEAAITWELYRSSGPFNALGKETVASLITAKELEERHMVGADSTAIATATGLAGTPSITGGALTAADSAYSVCVAALNYYGWWYYVQDGLPAADLALASGIINTQGIAQVVTGSGTTIASGIAGSIAATCNSVKGAWGYVWYIAKTGSPTAFKLVGATVLPKFTFTAAGTVVGSAPSTADGSTLDIYANPVIWDGMYAQIVRDADIPGEYTDNASLALSTTGSGSGVTQVETIFANLARKWHLSPDMAIMSPTTLGALSNVAIGSSAPAYRLLVEAGGDGKVKAGTMLSSLRNQYMGTEVETVVEPIMADGKIIFYTKNIDYPDAGVNTNMELHCTDHFMQDFFARTTDVAPPGPWAIKTYGAPTLYWPRSCGAIDNILT